MPAKTLYLLRHAHTEKGDAITPDHERCLSPGGLEECEAIGKWLKNQNPQIDYVLSSDAVRTRETYREIHKACPLPKPEFTPQLYLAPAGKMMNLINKLPSTVNSAMVIGHNPGLHEFSERVLLDEEAAAEKIADGFLTGSLFIVEVPVTEWDLLSFGIGRFKHYVTPKSVS